MNYYILSTTNCIPFSDVFLEEESDDYGYSLTGDIVPSRRRKFPLSPPPVRHWLETEDPVNDPPLMEPFYTGDMLPLIREDLLQAILEAGADNLQIFDAIITEPITGKEYRNYKAVNIVGMVDVSDKKKTVYMGIGDEIFPDHVKEAHFDGSLPDNTLIFLMSANSSAIVIHEKVRRYIEKHKIQNLYYYGSGKWAG
jgi:hypothetical protein